MHRGFALSCGHTLRCGLVLCALQMTLLATTASVAQAAGPETDELPVTRCFAAADADWQSLRLTVVERGSGAFADIVSLRFSGIPEGATVHVDADGDGLDLPPPRLGVSMLDSVRWVRKARHKIRLFHEIPGDPPWIEERGCWIFRGSGSNGIENGVEETSLRADASADLAWQLIDEDGADPESVGSIQGSLGVDARAAGQGWRLRARVDQAHGERLESTPGLESAPSQGTFLLEAGLWRDGAARPAREGSGDAATNALDLAFGDQDYGRRLWGFEPGLIFGTFVRRGISVRFLHAGSGLRSGVFLTSSRPTDSWASIGESRIAGAVAGQRTQWRGGELRLGAVYLDGEASERPGAGEARIGSSGAENTLRGVAADVSFLRGRGAVRGELAESRHDPDGGGDPPAGFATDDAASRRDRAFSLGVELSDAWRPSDSDLDWWLGLERRRVGTFFRSLAHPALAADLDTEEATLGASWRRFEGELRIGRLRDDVEDLDALPETESTTTHLSLTYRPPPARRWTPEAGRETGEAERGWRAPTVSLHLYDSDSETEALGGITGPSERSIRSLSVAAYSTAWDLDYSRDEYRDGSPSSLRTVSEVARLGLRLGLARWWLEPSLQASRFEAHGTTESLLARVTLRLPPGKVRSLFRADLLHRDDATRGDVDQLVVSGDLEWRLRRPAGHRPGFDLWLRGTYADEDFADAGAGGAVADPSPLGSTQIFLGARLSWRGAW